MSLFYAKSPSSGVDLEPGENLLIWFGGSKIEGCENALLKAGGDLLLLKTVKVFGQVELNEMSQDYQKWQETFGTGLVSDEIRSALKKFREINS